MSFLRRQEEAGVGRATKPGEEVQTILGCGAEFEGRLIFKGAVRIDGKFKGDVVSPDSLTVGENANVQADMQVGTLVVDGVCKGNVSASTLVELHHSSQFYGTISSPSLVVEKGAKFEGSCSMEKHPKSDDEFLLPESEEASLKPEIEEEDEESG